MYQATLFIYAFKGNPDRIRAKLAALTNQVLARCEIVVYAESPPLQRFYFFEDAKLSAVAEEYRNSVKEWAASITAPLLSENALISVDFAWSKSAFQQKAAAAKSSELLLFFCSNNSLPPLLRNLIEDSHCPVLVLGDKNWHNPVSILAGIDPFHRGDRSGNIDTEVVRTALAFKRKLNGDFSVVHSCFTPPFLVKYRTIIQATHRQVVEDFMAEQHWRNIDAHMLYGDPSDTIPNYCQTHQIDLLVIGLGSRGYFNRQVIGSTCDKLMDTFQYDLLIIPSPQNET
ncbi:universal stress protein [Ferrimonas pelagia]|uniref:UspA domain-containing protein n=1 Tax=Ferrimonas pelagia TaxID=1177826 RepID=A0ABP9EM33_9GAMM